MSDVDPRQAAELFRDRRWRLDHLYWIQDEKGRKIRFRMNGVQRKLLDDFWHMNLVLKSRQHGITTFICILYLDVCLFNGNKSAGIIAHTLDDAESIFTTKVKFAYDNLPGAIKNEITTVKDSGKVLRLSNGSVIRVGVSMRGGTNQYLHISEFGKVCAKYPEKAREIVTGALNTVHVGQYVVIESTAEGRSGHFYEFCQEAQKRQKEGIAPSQLEYRLHFFGWWQDPRNRLETAGGCPFPPTCGGTSRIWRQSTASCFAAQKGWYLAKRKTQGDDMYREYPSTPEEAFFAAIQGAYYQAQMSALRNKQRMTLVPYDPRLAVDTGWDLGMDDTTCIVFRQRHGMENRIIDYVESCGESLQYYVKVLQGKSYTYPAPRLSRCCSPR